MPDGPLRLSRTFKDRLDLVPPKPGTEILHGDHGVVPFSEQPNLVTSDPEGENFAALSRRLLKTVLIAAKSTAAMAGSFGNFIPKVSVVSRRPGRRGTVPAQRIPRRSVGVSTSPSPLLNADHVDEHLDQPCDPARMLDRELKLRACLLGLAACELPLSGTGSSQAPRQAAS